MAIRGLASVPTAGITSNASIQPNIRDKYTSTASGYVPALTGIRALAASLVLGFHFYTEHIVPVGINSLLPFFTRGYLGVDFFFLLSGFIITHVYLTPLACPNRITVQSAERGVAGKTFAFLVPSHWSSGWPQCCSISWSGRRGNACVIRWA